MIWLIALVVMFQFGFQWFMQPAIQATTSIVEFRSIGFFLFLIFIWLVSGRLESDGP